MTFTLCDIKKPSKVPIVQNHPFHPAACRRQPNLRPQYMHLPYSKRLHAPFRGSDAARRGFSRLPLLGRAPPCQLGSALSAFPVLAGIELTTIVNHVNKNNDRREKFFPVSQICGGGMLNLCFLELLKDRCQRRTGIQSHCPSQFNIFSQVHFPGRLAALWRSKSLNHHSCSGQAFLGI